MLALAAPDAVEVLPLAASALPDDSASMAPAIAILFMVDFSAELPGQLDPRDVPLRAQDKSRFEKPGPMILR
jgi:hypothetical protein